MEQIKTGIDNNLSKGEMQNVFFAVACGCLLTIVQITPGAKHTKRKRTLLNLHNEVFGYAVMHLPKVNEANIPMFNDIITASTKVMDKIVEETGQSGVHVMLNLVGFCMENFPVLKKHTDKYNSLFELWGNEARQYEDARAGDRIFQRIESEAQILVAQRGGSIL